MFEMDARQILDEAKALKPELIRFARELISLPGTSGEEEKVARCIEKEMKKIGFDNTYIDKMGNVIGKIGDGSIKILMDAHIDTVGTGDLSEWEHDPYKGKLENDFIYGRGATDQKGGMVSLVYSALLMKKLDLLDDFTVYVTGTCHEETCEGLPLFHIMDVEHVVKPDYVVLSEPTDLRVARGHRGRMEMRLTTKGKSCHASTPDQGINAVYRMQPIIKDIEELNKTLKDDDFLGKGTITVTKIECQTPALCAVPNECTIYIDRRLTSGETKETVFDEINTIIKKYSDHTNIEFSLINFEADAWTGYSLQMEKYFPGWVIPEAHVLTKAAIDAATLALGKEPVVGKWDFATNGIATMGFYDIPTIGFGPANDAFAHTVEDQLPVEHLVIATAFYAMFPKILIRRLKQ